MSGFSLVIAPVARHRVVDIDDRRDEAELTDVLVSAPMRIPISIDPLAVLQRGLDVRTAETSRAYEDLDSPEHMLFYDFHFMGVEAARLVQYFQRDLHFADAMEEYSDSGNVDH